MTGLCQRDSAVGLGEACESESECLPGTTHCANDGLRGCKATWYKAYSNAAGLPVNTEISFDCITSRSVDFTDEKPTLIIAESYIFAATADVATLPPHRSETHANKTKIATPYSACRYTAMLWADLEGQARCV